MPLVREMLAEAGTSAQELDLIAVMRGPGSFTGLRIGMSTAKGLAEAIAQARELPEAPIVSVPTLEVMASCLSVPGYVAAAIDARKNRFYVALFGEGERLSPDLDCEPDELLHLLDSGEPNTVTITGPHAGELASRLDDTQVVLDPEHRRAYAPRLLTLGRKEFLRRGADPADTGPVYLRGSDAELSRRRS